MTPSLSAPIEPADAPVAEPAPQEQAAERPNTRMERMALASGGMAENAFQNSVLTLANPIFNIGMQVSPVVVGIAMAVPRFCDMILDPWVGIWSDRTRSRWGRRVPYIVLSCFVCMALFAAIWWVPQSWSVISKGWWLIVMYLLFNAAYSFFAVPYAALAIEETVEGADRMRVMTSRTAFINVSALGASWLYWLCQSDVFESPVMGIRWVGLAFGVVIGLTGLFPVWAALRKRRARSREMVAREEAQQAQPEGKRTRLHVFLRIPAMRCVVISLVSILLGFTLVGHLGFYLVAYHACLGDMKLAGLVMGISATATAVSAIIVAPMIGKVAERIGKRSTLMLFLFLGILASISKWWLITPANPYLSIVCNVGVTIGLAGFLSLMPTFLGDISDYWIATKSEECQGALSAIYGVAVKVGASLALMATGYILVICGFQAGMPQEQMGETIFRMRIFYSLIPALAGAGAMLAMSRFRI